MLSISQYALMSYGISPSTLICDQNGNLKSNMISQFVHRQMILEGSSIDVAAAPAPPAVGVPTTMVGGVATTTATTNAVTTSCRHFVEIATDNDVMLGRGCSNTIPSW